MDRPALGSWYTYWTSAKSLAMQMLARAVRNVELSKKKPRIVAKHVGSITITSAYR